jgi:hypothetical protein
LSDDEEKRFSRSTFLNRIGVLIIFICPHYVARGPPPPRRSR